MRRFLACLIPALFASVLAVGCTSTPSRAVIEYKPASFGESRDQSALMKSDDRARADIDVAEFHLRQASDKFAQARGLLEAEELPPGAVRPTEEEVRQLYQAAFARYRDMQELIARETHVYQQFMKRYPHNWFAHHRLAWFLADNYLHYEAADQWEEVIRMQPDFPYAYNNLGSLYNHMGRDAEAIQLFRKAIDLKGDDPVFYVNLAVNYSTHRKEAMELYGWDLPRTFRECIAAYRRARDLMPEDLDVARDLATQYVLAKYFKVTDTADDALDAWNYYLALDLSPAQRGYAMREVARIWLRDKKDRPAASKWLTDAKTLVGNDPGIENLLKEARGERKGPDEEEAAEKAR
jgi:tetratricopeptide (TPR) repeat protein